MAVGIKAMHSICSIRGEQTMLILQKSFIFSRFPYPPLLLTRITSSLLDTIDNKSIVPLKLVFFGKKYEILNDLREKYQVRPVRAIFNIKAACYLWKKQNKKLLVFNRGLQLSTSKAKVHTRKKQLNLQLFCDSILMEN